MKQHKVLTALVLAGTIALTGCGSSKTQSSSAKTSVKSSSSSKSEQSVKSAQTQSTSQSQSNSGKKFVLSDSGKGLVLDDKFHFTVNNISLYLPCTEEDLAAAGLWDKMCSDKLDKEKYDGLVNDKEILAAMDCDMGDLNLMFNANKAEGEVKFYEAFINKAVGKEKASVKINGAELIIGETTKKEFIEKMSEFEDIAVENGESLGDETEIVCKISGHYTKIKAWSENGVLKGLELNA